MAECNHGVQHWRQDQKTGSNFCTKCDSEIKKDAYGVWHVVAAKKPTPVELKEFDPTVCQHSAQSWSVTKADGKTFCEDCDCEIVPHASRPGVWCRKEPKPAPALNATETALLSARLHEHRSEPYMFDEATRRYEHDWEFKAVVDQFIHLALARGYTPHEMKQVAYCAALRIETLALRAFGAPRL
jgi:hypothetical protein